MLKAAGFSAVAFLLVFTLGAHAADLDPRLKASCDAKIGHIDRERDAALREAFANNSKAFEHMIKRVGDMIDDLNDKERKALVDYQALPFETRSRPLVTNAFWDKVKGDMAGDLNAKGDCEDGSLYTGTSDKADSVSCYEGQFANLPPGNYEGGFPQYNHDLNFVGFFKQNGGYGCISGSAPIFGAACDGPYWISTANQLEEFKYTNTPDGLTLTACEYTNSPKMIPACVSIPMTPANLAPGAYVGHMLGRNKNSSRSIIDLDTYRAALNHPKAIEFAQDRDSFPRNSDEGYAMAVAPDLQMARELPRAYLEKRIQAEAPECLAVLNPAGSQNGAVAASPAPNEGGSRPAL